MTAVGIDLRNQIGRKKTEERKAIRQPIVHKRENKRIGSKSEGERMPAVSPTTLNNPKEIMGRWSLW